MPRAISPLYASSGSKTVDDPQSPYVLTGLPMPPNAFGSILVVEPLISPKG